MDTHPPGDLPAPADAEGTLSVLNATATGAKASADGIAVPASPWAGRRLIIVMLIAAAALDLARCGIVITTARHVALAAGLVAVGLAAAVLSLSTARGCQRRRRWSGWAAMLIGAASTPQAAASGFHAPYAIPNIATAALGILLTVAVLATIGQSAPPDESAGDLCPWTGGSPDEGPRGNRPAVS
jgi:hypothetical protein